jgi:hypothetical protein
MPDLAELDPKEALITMETENLSLWSDEKKTDYCKLLAERTRVARFILIVTAAIIVEKAEARRFISRKHYKDIAKGFVAADADWHRLFQTNSLQDKNPHGTTIGGRNVGSLQAIAAERAETILRSLPPLKKAVEIIDVETANKIRRKEKLLEEGQVLKEELDEVCGTIHMATLDQSMTIGEFRKMVHDRESRRLGLIRKLNAISDESRALEEQIAKALYAGLPGLSQAVVDVVRSYIEQSLALEETHRRIEEQIRFGDSAAALAVLRQFEQDEIKISSAVADKFKNALEELKLSVGRGRKGKRLGKGVSA